MYLQFSRDCKFESNWVLLIGFSFWWCFMYLSLKRDSKFESYWVQLNGFNFGANSYVSREDFSIWENAIFKPLFIRCSWNKMMEIRGDQNVKSLKLYRTNFRSFSNKSSRIFWFERVQFSNLFSHWVQLKQNDENKRWPKCEILETLLYQL